MRARRIEGISCECVSGCDLVIDYNVNIIWILDGFYVIFVWLVDLILKP